jgi:hypothetical protein
MKDYNKVNRDNICFDDNETAEDLIITDMTDEELDAEYERLFNNRKGN